MITAAITAAIAAILGLFGIKPGPYLVGVAITVKVIIVALTAIFGARWAAKRAARKQQQEQQQPPNPGNTGG
jgi:amino acid transporter